MGPQRFRCGNHMVPGIKATHIVRFNGATTFPLWKSEIASGTARLAFRFNGATTFPLWKSDLAAADLIFADLASMGPQRFRCGNKIFACNVKRALRRFNGATTFPLWKFVFFSALYYIWTLLQWGHNVSVVEIILDKF